MGHRRRIYTEEKAKVVAVVWGREFMKFLAALAIFHYKTVLKKIMISSFSLNHPGASHPILFKKAEGTTNKNYSYPLSLHH